ncbi:YkgJ family cysteine cluster protein [Candidatus Margulisiibacteriota bacterium]
MISRGRQWPKFFRQRGQSFFEHSYDLAYSMALKSSCPILSEENDCSDYPARPLQCRLYPFTAFIEGYVGKSPTVEECPSLLGARMTKNQRRGITLLMKAAEEQRVIEVACWGGDGTPHFSFTDADQLLRVVAGAKGHQLDNDPAQTSEATQALLVGAEQIESFVDSGSFVVGPHLRSVPQDQLFAPLLSVLMPISRELVVSSLDAFTWDSESLQVHKRINGLLDQAQQYLAPKN